MLKNLKILSIEQYGAGPFGTQFLVDMGAEVIKIEPPQSGDALRKWRLLKDGTSVWWQVQSRNKRSLALDLRSAQGQELVRRLSQEADVLIENFRPGAMEWTSHATIDKLEPQIEARSNASGLTPPKWLWRLVRL